MTDRPGISVVVPLYRSTDTAASLMHALDDWASTRSGAVEVVLVDDGCPEDSATVFSGIETSPRLVPVILRHDRNRGQFAAIQTGLAHSHGTTVAIIDADLQDSPADLSVLLERLDSWPGIVCAGRSGHYDVVTRRLSARSFRMARHVLSRRRIPRDAGLCSVMRREQAQELLRTADDGEHPLTTAARTGIPITSVPVQREPRLLGRSSYDMRRRWHAAWVALEPLTPLRHSRPLVIDDRRALIVPRAEGNPMEKECTVPEPAVHNDYQRAYFSERALPRMSVDDGPATPYVSRHVDAVVHTASLEPTDRVLDVGCGPGKYTKELARRGFRVEGLDLTPALVEQMRAALPDIPAYVGDVVNPPEDLVGGYDAVVGFMMLHHLEDLSASFRGIRSLLRSGGRACFLEPNPFYPGFAVQIALTPGMTFRGEGGIYRLTPRHLHRALSGAGFRPRSLGHFGVFPPALANRRVGSQVEAALEKVPGWSPYQAFQVVFATAE